MRILMIAVLLLCSFIVTIEAQSLKKWTILVYLDADNNLESEGIIDVNEMEQVGSDDNINIVVQFDRTPGYDFSNGNWTTTRRYYITKDTNKSFINSTMITDLGEKNMGAEATLTDFLRWGMTNYPAERYFLILWNHGGGWRSKSIADTKKKPSLVKGVCWDDTDNDYLTMAEVNSSITTITNEFAHPLNIIGFDACIMGLAEVAYMVKGPIAHPTEAVVFSQANEPGGGWDYSAFLTSFRDNYNDSAVTLAHNIVDTYYEYYIGSDNITLSVLDMSYFPAFMMSLNAFKNGATREWSTLQKAATSALRFDNAYRDLIHITDYCRKYYFSQELKTLAEDLYQKSTALVSHRKNTGSYTHASGLNIYFPLSSSDSEWSAYTPSNAYMLNEVTWHTYLATYFSADKTAPTTPAVPGRSSVTDGYTISWGGVSGSSGYMLREKELFESYIDSNFDNASLGNWSKYSASGYAAFTLTTTAAHSPRYSLFSGSGNNLIRGMQSKEIIIPNDSLPYTLSLWINYTTEAGLDVFYIDILQGTTLTNLGVFSGSSDGWLPIEFDLAAFKGTTVRVVLRYLTDDNVSQTGVFIDDIQVHSAQDTLFDTGTSLSRFFDEKPEGTIFHYAVAAYDAAGNISDFSGDFVYSYGSEIPIAPTLSLYQNYPNPFNPSTEISYRITTQSFVTMTIYSSKGKKLTTLVSEVKEPGIHTVFWNGLDARGRKLPSGVYYCHIISGGLKAVKKMILLK